MRSSLKMIATAAFAVYLMPAFLPHAGEAAAQTSTATPYTSVGVVPDLAAVAEDVQGVLSLEDFLHEVGDHVAHRELHVARKDLLIPQRPALPDADAVEWADDRVGKPVLVVGGAREVLHRELLEAV